MKTSLQTYNNPNFTARQLSQWSCRNLQNKTKNIAIVAIEKRDAEFMQKFLHYVEGLNNDNPSAKEIMVKSTKTIIEILRSDLPNMEKIKIFIATYNNTPCGILVANIPKHNPVDKSIVHSSRHNPCKNETEIDWLVTWNPTEQKIKGIGKAIVGEYFRTVKKDKYRDIFVRSEIPEKSFATYFYEALGFRQIGSKKLKLSNKNSAQAVVEDFSQNNNDDTIPMIITRKNIGQTATKLSKEMHRREFLQTSENAKFLINI